MMSLPSDAAGPIRLEYNSNMHYIDLARRLEIMEDEKEGVWRTAYMGVVPLWYSGRKLYVAPQRPWAGYRPRNVFDIAPIVQQTQPPVALAVSSYACEFIDRTIMCEQADADPKAAAVLVMACNRVEVAALLEAIIKHRPPNFPLIISQDCRNDDVTAVVAQYADGRAIWLTVRACVVLYCISFLMRAEYSRRRCNG